MPELPEVEQVRRSLRPHLVGRVIRGVEIRRPGFIAGTDRPTPADLLAGDRVVAIERVGKFLAAVGASGRAVQLHLGMTGRFIVRASVEDLAGIEHVHVVWKVEEPASGAREVVGFCDPRRFGEVRPCASADALREAWSRLGPDALTITPETLGPRLRPGRRAIKAALLDQRVLAGVGNIYADEALFDARLGPRRHAGGLSGPEIARLCGAIRSVLASAIDAGGSTLRDFVDADGAEGSYRDRHKVYGRGGETCVVCGGVLRSGLIAQRTSVWCPVCQQRPGGGGRARGRGAMP